MITKLIALLFKGNNSSNTTPIVEPETIAVVANRGLSMENQLQLITSGYASHPHVTKEALDAAQLAMRLRYMTVTSQELSVYPQETLENLYILWNLIFDKLPAEQRHTL